MSSSNLSHEEEAERQEREKIASELANRGLVFERVPPGVYEGMPFVTPAQVIQSRITRYTSLTSITNMICDEENPIPSYVIGRTILLPPEGVIAIIAKDRETDNPHRRGAKPGKRQSRRVKRMG